MVPAGNDDVERTLDSEFTDVSPLFVGSTETNALSYIDGTVASATEKNPSSTSSRSKVFLTDDGTEDGRRRHRW